MHPYFSHQMSEFQRRDAEHVARRHQLARPQARPQAARPQAGRELFGRQLFARRPLPAAPRAGLVGRTSLGLPFTDLDPRLPN